MAPKPWLSPLALVLLFCVSHALGGGITCEDLGRDTCAYAVTSKGMRCVLEKRHARSSAGEEAYTCEMSGIMAGVEVWGWVETDECVRACGLNRGTLGVSSDSLLEPEFTRRLCSPDCYHRCPNIVDLYFNLAAGEGVFLPTLCEAQRTNVRRAMAEIRSAGAAFASGPNSAPASKLDAFAPATPPM